MFKKGESVDSEYIIGMFDEKRFEFSSDPKECDVIIINTCGFILSAKKEAIDTILEMAEYKKGRLKKLIVTGCLAQRYYEDLKKDLPEVDAFIKIDDYDDLNDILKELLGEEFTVPYRTNRKLITNNYYGYLKIAEGCDNRCAYCAIPLIRGNCRSFPIEDLYKEAMRLYELGVKELNVIAQDTTYYGLDLYGERRLGRLLSGLSGIDGIEWIRLLYSYPAAFPEDVLEIMASSPKICRYLDIPLQHSADPVLKAMRRSIDARTTRSLVESFRSRVPGIVLRTTMMVGHPGEGEREFEDLLSFVSEYRFERLGAFAYSEEEGTWGAQNLKDTVPESVKQERLDELMELQAAISLKYNESRIGGVERVLVDSCDVSARVCSCRSSGEAPEVDGEILLECQKGQSLPVPGEFVDVRITGADEYDLNAELI